MVNATDTGCRLCLVTPADRRLADLLPHLSDALAAGDVASVLFLKGADAESGWRNALAEGVRQAQARGVAALLHESIIASESGLTAELGADGVQVAAVADAIAAAMEDVRPDGIVGLGGITNRHIAMSAAEAEPDFLFFGRPDGDTAPDIEPSALALADWWSSVAVVPAIVMGGTAVASVEAAARRAIEFVALGRAVWDHPEGPGKAVADANDRLSRQEAAA